MRKKREAGFGLLLELLIAMAITTTILAGSTAIVYRVKATQNQSDAQTRLRQIARSGGRNCNLCANGGMLTKHWVGRHRPR